MIKKFAVLGFPIGHSLSPLLHNELFRMRNLPCFYEAVLMPPDDLEKEFDGLKSKYSGFNCTIPLKERVLPLLDDTDALAKELGSVNTVVCKNTTKGYSTDSRGFLRSLKMHNLSLEGKRVLIVGGGGVARVIALTCAKKDCNITLALRNPAKGEALCEEISRIYGVQPEITSLDCIEGSFDLLVQCTPVGMFPNVDSCPVSDEVISRCDAVFDTVYNPIKTLILKKAEAMGKVALSGLEMLVFQGLASEEYWLDIKATDAEAMHLVSILREKLNGTKNIALVGFMACGKSTIGKALAHELGYTFIDTDTIAETLDGRPIPKIFDEEGEAYFRDLETLALKSVADRPCSVIATGGGIVSRPENLEILKQNCFVVFLDVPFDIMAERASCNNNRPLFRDKEKAYGLWQKRHPLYEQAADLVYDGHDDMVSTNTRCIAESYRTFLKKGR